MRRSIHGLALGLLLGLAAITVTRGVDPLDGRGVLASLKVGQPVVLKDLGTAYEVRVMDETLPTGEEVAEVGEGYVVVKTKVGVETRIPITSIKAVVVTLAR